MKKLLVVTSYTLPPATRAGVIREAKRRKVSASALVADRLKLYQLKGGPSAKRP